MRAADPVRARRSAWWTRHMEAAFGRLMKRHFHALRILKTGWPDTSHTGSYAIASNHPGWWDPLLFIHLQRRFFPHHISYGPMDAEALRRYPLFAKLGIFGIASHDPAGHRAFLQTSRDLLSDPRACLWITVPGGFQDVRSPLIVQPGLSHAARDNTVILPLAIEYVFWNEKMPEILIAFGNPLKPALAHDTQRALQTELQGAMTMLAQAAQSRDATLFDTLWISRSGASRWYDLYRRLRAAWRGEKFSSSHMDAAG